MRVLVYFHLATKPGIDCMETISPGYSSISHIVVALALALALGDEL